MRTGEAIASRARPAASRSRRIVLPSAVRRSTNWSSPISIGLPPRPGSGLARKYSRMCTASSPISSGLRALLAIAIVRSFPSGRVRGGGHAGVGDVVDGDDVDPVRGVAGQVGEAAGGVGEDQRVGDLDPLQPARARLLEGRLDDRRPHDRRRAARIRSAAVRPAPC